MTTPQDDSKSKSILHWVVVILSIILTLSAWRFSKNQVEEKLQDKFDREVAQVLDLVQERMDIYENVLKSGAAMFNAQDNQISREQWRKFAEKLDIVDNYPGIGGIGVIYAVKRDLIAQFTQDQQQSFPGFKLHPSTTPQETHWPITYIEPETSNLKAVGLDMAFEKHRHQGVLKAALTGKDQITAPITLVQEWGKTPGFLFYHPFYQGSKIPKTEKQRLDLVKGAIYAPFTVSKLLEGTLSQSGRYVDIQIFDENFEIYDELKSNQTESNYIDTKTLELYGRTWTFNFKANQSFVNSANTQQSTIILIAGIFIDALLIFLFYTLSRSRKKAMAQALKMTEEARTKTKELEHSNEELKNFARISSHDLKSPIHGIQKLAEWTLEDDIQSLSESSRNNLEMILTRSTRLKKLLKDLHQYSHIESNSHDYQIFQLRNMVQDVVGLIGAPEDISWYSPQVSIEGPTIIISTVLRNLFTNTLKHSGHSQPEIEISYESTATTNTLIFHDNGVGIPGEYAEKIFGVFQTLQPRDIVEGSGMGLSICRKMLHAINGQITLDKDNTTGCRFVITWPKKQGSQYENA